MYGTRPADSDQYENLFKTLLFRTLYRNAVTKNGELLGYGIVTGEPEATEYLMSGSVELEAGDTALIYSDGCENIITDPQFQDQCAGCESKEKLEQCAERFIDASHSDDDKTLVAGRIDE
jgi:hypothetical protein